MAESVQIEPTFPAWRSRARDLLEEGIPPEELLWSDSSSGQDELFGSVAAVPVQVKNPGIKVPKAFFPLAETVACHSDESRWGLLYRILWRLTRGSERQLLLVSTDDDIRRASYLAKEVRRDCHKMRAFVRFRKVGEREGGREQFVSWFEPSHHIVRFNAPFFRKRFTGMDWSILTPDECAHWDGEKLRFSEGVSSQEAPNGDALEELWRSYYKSIFNPSRLKLKAMQAEMPVKYWKNLPEAPLIQELTVEASTRRDRMIEKEAQEPSPAPKNLYLRELHHRNEAPRVREKAELEIPETLEEMQELASCCRMCPLWDRATQTVFGEGNPEADLMIVGEQPGDQEDLAGRPFVGPSGQLLDDALLKAGLKREKLYVTNAVKHFKWKPAGAMQTGRGPRRLHDKANRAEMKACRPWLLGEIARVKPRVILTLGNTAAESVIRPGFRILRERGEVTGPNEIGFEGRLFATVHPSYLLRIREQAEKKVALEEWVADLKRVADALA
ncbi:MAG: UdgX family uracil-DNA binding protein [Verrucomicrobiota bacterium]